jgi:hypothetical protein
MGRVSRHVPRALPVAHDDQVLRPIHPVLQLGPATSGRGLRSDEKNLRLARIDSGVGDFDHDRRMIAGFRPRARAQVHFGRE